MRRHNRFLFVLALLSLYSLSGCGRADRAGARYVVDLVAAVKSGEVRAFDLAALGTVEHRLVIDETEQPFASFNFFPVDEQSALVMDWDKAARVSLDDGSILARYGRKGRGPMEYTRLRSCSFLADTVYLRSNTKILAFDLEGQGIGESAVVSTQNLVLLPGGHYFRFNATDFKEDVPLFDVIDRSGNVLRQSSIVASSVGQTAILQLNNARKWDGDWYTLPAHSDMIWKISETEDVPWIRLWEGSYAMPAEYLADLEKYDEMADLYITELSYLLVGDYFLCRFARGDYHLAVFDLKTGKLLFHTTSKQREGLGFPIDYEGQTISLWPVFADEYHIICRGKTSEELWLLSRTPSHPA